MSENGGELVRLAERGERIKQVREAAKMTGDEFGEAINRGTEERGYAAAFDKTTVSRLEQGKATYLEAEIAVVIAKLDPEERGIDWLVFGDKRAARAIPKPSPSAPSSRDSARRKLK